ncbi:MAG TPA: hypothetical protein VH418_09190 [Solirubrobacteraceae bacterium]|jgi:hypothetical protein
MATAAYAQDVLALAQALAGADITREVIDRAPDAGEADVFIDVRAEAGELRPALAVQEAVQLCVDAAAIVVEASSRDGFDLGPEAVDAFLRDRIVELTVVDLWAGSFRGRFTINPRTENGRRRVLAIGGLAIVALHFAFPPLGTTLLVVGAAKELYDLIQPDTLAHGRVSPKSVDTADVAAAGAQLTITARPAAGESTTADDAATPPPRYVYDVDIHGSSTANRSFVERVHALEGVERQSRPVVGDEYQRVRIWSSEPLDAATLARLAQEAGTEIVGQGPGA